MADDNTVQVVIGATIDDFKSKMGEVTSIFSEITEKFAALAAVVAGGAAFKEFIDSTIALTGESQGLSKSLGITLEDASTLNTALGAIGSDSGTYIGAFEKFNRQLRTNSATLKELGVDVDGFRSGQKTSNELFEESIKIVGQYAPGIDRTQVAMQLFGRSVGDVQKLLKLNNDVLAEAQKRNEELNLTITAGNVAAAKAYKRAMDEVHNVLQGVEKTIGEAVIPAFTRSAQQLASFGPLLVDVVRASVETFIEIMGNLRESVATVIGEIVEIARAGMTAFGEIFGGSTLTGMEVFHNALDIISAAFIGFRIAVQLVVQIVRTDLEVMQSTTSFVGEAISDVLGGLGAAFSGFGATARAALNLISGSGTWDQVIAAARNGANGVTDAFAAARGAIAKESDERNRILEDGTTKAVAIAQKGQDDLARVLRSDAEKAADKAGNYGNEGRGSTAPGGKRAPAPADKGASALAQAQNALLKAQAEADLAVQKAYFDEVEKLLDDSYKQGLLSTKDYYQARLQVELAGIDAEVEAKRKELDSARALEAEAASRGAKGAPDVLKAKAQEVAISAALNVLEIKRAETIQASANAIRDAERARLDGLAAFEAAEAKGTADNRVERERGELEQLKALRQVSAEDAFEIEKKLEDESYAALRASLDAKGALIRGNDAEQAKARQALALEIESAEQKHQLTITQIDQKAELDRKALSIQAQQSVQSNFATMINDLLSGTKKVGDVFRSFAISVANTFTNLIAQKFTERLFNATGINKAVDGMVDFLTSGISKMVASWFGGQTAMTAATTAGTAARTAAESEASATSIATTAFTAIKNIAAWAWQAAAAVYASVAAIPIVGAFLAPGLAIAAGTLVLGFISRVASSAGGDARVDEDRLNFVHKDETILPAEYASGLRSLISLGAGKTLSPSVTNTLKESIGAWRVPVAISQAAASTAPPTIAGTGPTAAGAQAPKGGDEFHLHLSAIDGPSAKKFLTDNGAHIASALRGQARSFVKGG